MPDALDFVATLRPSRRDLLLVAAEDASVRSALVSRLQEEGYSVLQVTSGAEALATLRLTRVVLVVSALADPSALSSLQLPVVVASEVECVNDEVARVLAAAR